MVATEVTVYSPGPLIEVLENLHRQLSVDSTAEEPNQLGDFGEHLLPALIKRGHVYAYPLPGYWRDLGRPETYYAAHTELLDTDTDLFDPDWPITTNTGSHLPARLEKGSRIVNSMISPGCRIAGSVDRSVIGPGVTIAAGARVCDSILHADVVVEADATIHTSIIATGCTIGAGARIGPSRRGTRTRGTSPCSARTAWSPPAAASTLAPASNPAPHAERWMHRPHGQILQPRWSSDGQSRRRHVTAYRTEPPLALSVVRGRGGPARVMVEGRDRWI